MSRTAKNYYYILGIQADASLQQIKTAHRKISMKFHPDKNDGDKFFEERFKDIQEAYEVLSDPLKRRQYDSSRNEEAVFQDELLRKEQDLRQRQEALHRKEEEIRRRERKVHEEHQTTESAQAPIIIPPITHQEDEKIGGKIILLICVFGFISFIIGLIIYDSGHKKSDRSEEKNQIDFVQPFVNHSPSDSLASNAKRVDGIQHLKPPRGYFSIGSTKDEVLAAQGTPTAFTEYSWLYGLSEVHFENNKVTDWVIAATDPLKVRMMPDAPKAGQKKYFTTGSTKDDVLIIQGTPTSFSDNAWQYGLSEVRFINDKVTGWTISATDPIKVRMIPSKPVTKHLKYFTVGSTKDEVLTVQGTPTDFNDFVWQYGLSEIHFSDDKVTSWSNCDTDPLKVKMKINN